MKIWSSEHVFDHPWETVVNAAWQKYPNPINTSVTGIDTVERTVQPDGLLKTHRILKTEWGVPLWLTRFIGVNNECFASEHSEVSPSQRTMRLWSRNLTLSNLVTIDEHVVYKPHPTDLTKTVLHSESSIQVQGLPMTSYLENLITGTMMSKAGQGRQAMEWVITRVKEETQDIGRAARDEIKELASSISMSSL